MTSLGIWVSGMNPKSECGPESVAKVETEDGFRPKLENYRNPSSLPLTSIDQNQRQGPPRSKVRGNSPPQSRSTEWDGKCCHSHRWKHSPRNPTSWLIQATARALARCRRMTDRTHLLQRSPGTYFPPDLRTTADWHWLLTSQKY